MARARPRQQAALDLSSWARVVVGIVSDTHAFLDPRVLEAIAGADLVVHGGDVGNGAVLDELRAVTGRVLAVHGNNDVASKWPENEADVVASLPAVGRVALPGGTLVVEHGHEAGAFNGRHARLRKRYPEARAVCVGHSHLLTIDDEAEPWVLNPGAAGRERTHGGPSYISLVATVGRWDARATRFPPLARRRAR